MSASLQRLPIISPTRPDDVPLQALLERIDRDRQSLLDRRTQAGALLFRGFGIDEPAHFEQVAAALHPGDLKNDYLGTSPRNIVPGTQYVFSASELPSYYPIPQHIEMSFLPTTPHNLLFYCDVAPNGNGETPICDFRRVYQELDPHVRDLFEERGVHYIRNYDGPNAPKTGNLWQLKPWPDMFQTTDKQQVEAVCAENDLTVIWGDHDRLTLRNNRPAVMPHPLTGEKAWFNHTQVFHAEAAAIEYGHIARRQRSIRSHFFAGFTDIMTRIRVARNNPENLAMHVTYGDGKQIPKLVVRHVLDVIWRNTVFCPWQKGDVLWIDNFSTSHGRMPYSGPRVIHVCWTA